MAQEARLQRHRTYQKYAEKEMAAGRKPTKFKDYELEPVYFRGVAKQTAESQLKSSGLSQSEIDRLKAKPSARLQRHPKKQIQPSKHKPKEYMYMTVK
jgi:hypothetical protein